MASDVNSMVFFVCVCVCFFFRPRLLVTQRAPFLPLPAGGYLEDRFPLGGAHVGGREGPS